MKFKPKPKLAQRLTALFLAIVTAITALPITALAGIIPFEGAGAGAKSTPAKEDAHTYGLHYTTALASWRVTLYVSTSDDGKIDPKRDSISGTGLGKVGTIFYNNIFETYGKDNIPADVFVQATANTETRTAGFDNTMPVVSQIEPSHTYIHGSEVVGDKIYIRSGSEVRKWLYRVDPYDNAASGDPEFTQTVIEQMNVSLGGSSALVYKVAKMIGSEPKQAVIDSGYDFELLLPTNDDCVVEWCCVVEPLVERCTLQAGALWYARLYDSGTGSFSRSFIQQTASDPSQVLLLDAYETALYNENTRKLFSTSEHLDPLTDNAWIHITGMLTDLLDMDTIEHDEVTCLTAWGNRGQLLAEYGNTYLKDSAIRCYDTHKGYEGKTYCGVPVAGSGGANYSYDGTAYARQAATYGGIAVLTTEINDNKIPVYYYIYDENNNFLRKETDSYTQNETHTFQPSTDYGTPIAMESTSRGDKFSE